MKIDVFKASDLMELDEQEATQWLRAYVRPEHAAALERGMSYTARVDGKIVVCAGVVEHWEGRGEAWAFLAKDSGKHFVAIHRAVKRFLDVCPIKRIEAAVDYEFEPGHEWVTMLDFKIEAQRMRGYFPDGRDATLYARVRVE